MLLSLLSICKNAFVMTLEEESCDCCFGFKRSRTQDLTANCLTTQPLWPEVRDLSQAQ